MDMLKRRREMKRDASNLTKIEFTELCKTIRKRMRHEIRNYNTQKIKETIENNRNRKILKRKLMLGTKQILAIAEKDGTITRNNERIIKRIQEFYTELYKDTTKIIMDDKEKIQEEGSIQPISIQEIKTALKQIKNGKSPGGGDISIEMIKLGGDTLLEYIRHLFNLCIEEQNIPRNWNNASLILIFKGKGKKEEIKNYRPISLLSNLYKIFTKILALRLSHKLDSFQPIEQAGFRKGYSTIDHIHAIKQIIEKRKEFQRFIIMIFIDYEKAFDSIKTKAISKVLKLMGIDKAYIKLIENIYKKPTATVTLNGKSQCIELQKGIRQGDSLSPKLFTAVLQLVFLKLNWENKGIKIKDKRISHLRYADDIVLFSKSLRQIQEMLNQLNKESKKVGLKINIEKTKIMLNQHSTPINIHKEGSTIEKVEQFNYLGHRLELNGSMEGEMKRRIQLSWSAFNKLSEVFKSKLPLCLKRKTFNQCILPVLTYACETWTMSQKMIKKFQTTQRKMERIMLGITLKDKKRNTWIREQTQLEDIVTFIKRSKWRWAGHLARREDGRWTRTCTLWRPDTGGRKRGRPRTRWEDEVKKMGGEKWWEEAEDREEWKTMGEAFVQQWTENG